MADKRITDLTEKTTLENDDYLMIDNASSGSKKFKAKKLSTGVVYRKTVDLAKTASRTIALDMTDYSYEETDRIDVYINGLHGIQDTDYTLSVSGSSASVILTLTGTTGVTEKIEIVVIK